MMPPRTKVCKFAPCSQPETWCFAYHNSTVSVLARTFYEAREYAATLLGAPKFDIVCTVNPTGAT